MQIRESVTTRNKGENVVLPSRIGVRLRMLVGFQLDMEIRQNKQQFKYKLCMWGGGGGVDACLFLSVCTPKIRSAELRVRRSKCECVSLFCFGCSGLNRLSTLHWMAFTVVGDLQP